MGGICPCAPWAVASQPTSVVHPSSCCRGLQVPGDVSVIGRDGSFRIGSTNPPRLRSLPTRSAAVIHIAMIDLMARRLTGGNTPTWRGT